MYNVLLVEDNELDIEIVVRSFRRDHMAGIAGEVSLSFATSLREAKEQLSAQNFNAILLDLGLPDASGIELLSQVANLHLGIPIIILTGNEDDELGLEALRAGADDYLKKSSISPETLPRAVRYSIERNQRLLAESRLMATQAEILAAEVIQKRLLPVESPKLNRFDIAGKCLPAEKIGGDLFDYLASDEESCTGVVADVSGHGLPAAILMTELHGLLHGLIDQSQGLSRLMASANRRTEKATESYQFITMLAYQLDAREPSLTYISAGHPLWHLKSNGEDVALKTQHLPLGVHPPELKMSHSTVKLHAGDILVFPTDGVFETAGEMHGRFGISRMLETVRANHSASAAEIVDIVLNDVFDFASNDPTDDCTLVIVKVN